MLDRDICMKCRNLTVETDVLSTWPDWKCKITEEWVDYDSAIPDKCLKLFEQSVFVARLEKC